MKKIVLSFAALAIPVMIAFSQPPVNQQSNGNPTGGNPIGGSAPIGTGIALLISLGAGYAGKKIYDARKVK